MSNIVKIEPADREIVPQTAAEIRAHVNRVQEVMRAVMKDGTHFGTIPGTDKASLWKPGAEVLCMTFRIAPQLAVDDLSTEDVVRYRVRCTGVHQGTGLTLGEGIGECSSNEEKYKWRKAVCEAEFFQTDEDCRRLAFRRTRGGGHYTVQQVRMNPADVANTVLKMAAKRAQIAMTLNVTAASDCFTQDIEDLPPEYRDDSEPAPRKPVNVDAIEVPTAGPIPHGLPEGEVADHLAAIEAAEDMDSLKTAYRTAYSAAKQATDAEALSAFEQAKEARKSALEAE